MQKWLQRNLGPWVIKMSNRFGSKPNQERVFTALSKLFTLINANPSKRGKVLKTSIADKFIIFSDQHKGARDDADDFALAEKNYLAALNFYNQAQYHFINLGDSEELWENLLESVIKHNKQAFEAEKLFINRDAYTKIFGNHDLYWDNDPLSSFNLGRIYGESIPIYEGMILKMSLGDGKQLDIFLTHGHQGDLQSDGNWFSKWFVSTIWAPLQAFLKINPNTPAYDNQLKTKHNQMMFNWILNKKNTILITGHTHQPVFASLTHLERIYLHIARAEREKNQADLLFYQQELSRIANQNPADAPILKDYQPGYFNSGCCCFSDGDITGIEIDSGKIRLIKWAKKEFNQQSERIILEEMDLSDLLNA